jgi:uracil phosphoribosyltransferase
LFGGHVKIVDHPLAQEILTVLRDKDTDQITFRKGLVKLGRLIGYKLIENMPTEEVYVETPLGVKAKGVRIPQLRNIVIVNVLRAATAFVEGLLKALPLSRQGVVVAKRIEDKPGIENIWAETYYVKIPQITEKDYVIVADPMLATGSTLLNVLKDLSKIGKPKKMIVVSVISAPYGLNRVISAYPDVEIYTVAVDPELNEHGYIVPGLGDAGDRAFG